MNKFIIIILTSILCSSSSLFSQACHLLLIGDPDDKTIAFGTRKNLHNMEESFVYVTSVAGIPLHAKRIPRSGVAFTKYQINTWIRKISVANDDVIILYYSGHGYRTRKNLTIWPSARFSDGSIDFSKVIKKLFSKNAALYLILIDCCNEFTKDQKRYNPVKFEFKRLCDQLNKQRIAHGCRELLFKSYGVIIASATSPSEVGWNHSWDPNDPTMRMEDPAKMGGIFTNIFLNNFFQELQLPSAKWKQIFIRTKQECVGETHKLYYQSPQTPQYRIFLYRTRKSARKYKKYFYDGCIHRDPFAAITQPHTSRSSLRPCGSSIEDDEIQDEERFEE